MKKKAVQAPVEAEVPTPGVWKYFINDNQVTAEEYDSFIKFVNDKKVEEEVEDVPVAKRTRRKSK